MKRLIFAMPDGSVHVTEPGPARPGEAEPVWLDRVARKCCPEGGKLVAVMDESELPDRTHRDAWVWDGQRIVIDESRIKPKAAPVDAPPAGAVQAYDPRLDAIAQQLSERFQGVVEELWREFNAKQEETLQEAERRFRLGLEAIAVVGRVQSNEPVDLDAVPALVNEVKASGVPVTEEAVIAAADRHAARIHQIAAGRA